MTILLFPVDELQVTLTIKRAWADKGTGCRSVQFRWAEQDGVERLRFIQENESED